MIWEVPLRDGTVVALIRDQADARDVSRDGRQVVVYTLEEIGLMLENYRTVVDTKLTFPGATVTAIRRQSIEDPLQGIPDGISLEDTLNDPIPDFGADKTLTPDMASAHGSNRKAPRQGRSFCRR